MRQCTNYIFYVLELITDNVDVLRFPVSDYRNLIVKKDKAYLFMRVHFLQLMYLRFNGAEHTLLPRDESLVLIMSSRQKIKLSLIARFHKLPQHLNFFLRNAEFQIHLALDFTSRVHATRYVNAKDKCFVIFGDPLLQCTLQHVNYVIFQGDFLFFYQEHVRVAAKLAQPQTFTHLHFILSLFDFASWLYDGEFVQDGATFFAGIRVSSRQVFLCLFHPIKFQHEHIQICLNFRNHCEEGVWVYLSALLRFSCYLFREEGVVRCFLHQDCQRIKCSNIKISDLMNTDKYAIYGTHFLLLLINKRYKRNNVPWQCQLKLILYLDSIQNMCRRKHFSVLINLKLQFFIKESHFSSDTISDLIDSLRSSNYKSLKSCIQSHKQTMECVKWLIIVHNLILIEQKAKEQQIIQLLQLINAQRQLSSPLQTILLQKMVLPYKAYLLKRNSFSLKEMDPQFHCYVLINLIETALSFTNILYTIGRYLLKKNNFLVEFNLVMAKDLSNIYQVIDSKMDHHFRTQNVQIIQNINENMYNIFYNCYFNRFVSCLAPYWIDTDTIQPKSANEIRSALTPKIHFRTQKLLRNLNTYKENEVSIVMEETTKQSKPHLRSSSTIASNREPECSEEGEFLRKQRDNRERREFIFMAESILEAFKEEELQDQLF